MPWVVAASVSSGVEFGLFVNTQGWTYGTASASRQTVELYATRTYAVDVVVTTWPAGASATAAAVRRPSKAGTPTHWDTSL